MSFAIECEMCGSKQNLNDLTKGKVIEPSIFIDIATEDFEETGTDYLFIQCLNKGCSNTFEI